MAKRHLKLHASPRTWNVERKGSKFILKPRPGAHSLENSMGIATIMKKLGFCDTTKEVKTALNTGEIFVNNRVIKDFKQAAGFMDVISIPTKNLYYRVALDENGNLCMIEIDAKEAHLLPCKVETKRLVPGGKLQLNCHNGRSILQENKEFRPNDTVMFDLIVGKIIQRLPLKEGAHVLVTRGKQAGSFAKFEKLEKGLALFNISGHTHKGPINYLFVIGENEPAVKLR